MFVLQAQESFKFILSNQSTWNPVNIVLNTAVKNNTNYQTNNKLSKKNQLRSIIGQQMDDNYMLSGKQKYIKAPCFTGCVKSTVRVKICFTCKKLLGKIL